MMNEPKTDRRAAKKAAFISYLQSSALLGEAAQATGVSRRTVNNWRRADPKFDALVVEAQKNQGRRITEGQRDKWQEELADTEARLLAFIHELKEVAAPALVGEEVALARQQELQNAIRGATERADALRIAIESAEAHLARARADEAEQARKEAEDEAAGFSKAQLDAAEKVDAALAQLAEGWAEFVAASNGRQSAARRSGGRSRAAYQSNLVQAVWAGALNVGDALGLDRRLRVRARKLQEVVR